MKARKIVEEMDSYVPGRSQDEIAEDFNLKKEDIIKLGSNENPWGPSPKAMKAKDSASSDPLQHSTISLSTRKVRAAISRRAEQSGSQYRCAPAAARRAASATLSGGGKGDSLVLSLMNVCPRGCSPGT